MTSDDELLGALGEVLDADEPLRDAVADTVAGDAFALRRLDVELAELLYDTGLEATAGVRGDDDGRALSFAADGRELDVELRADATVLGRVSPADAELTIESAEGERAVGTDRLGRFHAQAAGGRLRFVIGGGHARPVVTPWIFR